MTRESPSGSRGGGDTIGGGADAADAAEYMDVAGRGTPASPTARATAWQTVASAEAVGDGSKAAASRRQHHQEDASPSQAPRRLASEVAVVLTTLSGQRFDLRVPGDSLVGKAKEQAAQLLGQPPEQQKWLLDEAVVLRDCEYVADQLPDQDSSSPAAITLQVQCVFLPMMFPVAVKVIHFTPPALSETGQEINVMVSPNQTVGSIKDEIAVDCGRRGSRGLRLMKGGVEMQDDRVVSSYHIKAGDTLHCVMCRPRNSKPQEVFADAPHINIRVKTTLYSAPGPSRPGPELAVAMPRDMTVEALKEEVGRRCGFMEGVQGARLLVEGVAMANEQPVEVYRVRENTLLHFIMVRQPTRTLEHTAAAIAGAPPAAALQPPSPQRAAGNADLSFTGGSSPSNAAASPLGGHGQADLDEAFVPDGMTLIRLLLPAGQHDLLVPKQATVGESKEVASAVLGAQKDLQRWLPLDDEEAEAAGRGAVPEDNAAVAPPLLSTPLEDGASLTGLLAGGRQHLVVRCNVLPPKLAVKIKVMYFTPPALSEAGPELQKTVSFLQTVASLKAEITAQCGLPETRRKMQLLVDRRQMKDESLLSAFPISPGETLHCVVYVAPSDRKANGPPPREIRPRSALA